MKEAALVKNDTVVNCIVLDDNDDIAAVAGMFGVDEAFFITEPIGIGWVRTDGVWSQPEPDHTVNITDSEDAVGSPPQGD